MFHILVVLPAGERPGYAIMQEVASLTGGAFNPGPVALYRTLTQLLELGLGSETAGAWQREGRRLERPAAAYSGVTN